MPYQTMLMFSVNNFVFFLFFSLNEGNNLLYLDPHTTQQAVNPERMSLIPDEVRSLNNLNCNDKYLCLCESNYNNSA